MAILMGDLRAALVEAEASNERATTAAEEVAAYQLRGPSLATSSSMLIWMTGGNLGLTLLILGKLFLG